jgi:steroid delta-isomerase-like uncharacterized protein
MKKLPYIVPLVLVFCFTIACQDKAAMAELEKYKAQAELEARNIEVIKSMTAELDNGDVNAFLKFFAPDFKFRFPSNTSKPMSREEEMAMAKMMMTAIPDMEHKLTEVFAVKDRVVVIYIVQGTHKAELEGIPPTGNKVAIPAISIFRVKDGLITEEIEEADMLGLYQQRGMELKPTAAKKK